MTAKEYLKQAYLLDKQIKYEIRNLEQLKSMRGQLQSYTYDERIGTNPNRNLEERNGIQSWGSGTFVEAAGDELYDGWV